MNTIASAVIHVLRCALIVALETDHKQTARTSTPTSYLSYSAHSHSRMELGIKASPMRGSSPHQLPAIAEVLSPTRLAKLPPIAGDGDPTNVLMQNACTELKDSMGHLLSEVSPSVTVGELYNIHTTRVRLVIHVVM